MPISADRFEEMAEDEWGPKPGTNAHEILSFLETNADQAFTQSEIADGTGVTRGSVGPTLLRLREAGQVDHKGTYWRVSDHARSLDGSVDQATAVASSHEAEPFRREEWQEHAVDPRESRE
jgi:DNA-binding IclR family transcriptional regulator